MKTEKISYTEGGVELEGHLVYDPAGADKRPLVLVSHAWAGQTDFERNTAEKLAELGFVGFALDMYGKGVTGQSVEENSKLMQPFVDDRMLLRRRMLAALKAAKGHALVDSNRIGAIGFCFGGMCVLDLARSGADISGVVSFHGLLGAPDLPDQDTPTVRTKVLVLHGFDDPMAKPEAMLAFANEMTKAGADWQIHAYGGTVHAFTNPEADDPGFGTVYNRAADQRSWIAMKSFFEEIFTG
ncbi:MAG: dienelactone hydrolase family protein [Proteobacteria bacterium]|nr:dienelactone hydrolase family protein [Pseudomonadota bacterium]